MADDVILNKAGVMERCIARIREEHGGDDENLMSHVTRQDSIILNLQRACEASIDLAMHLVKVNSLGVPQESRDAFSLLADAKLLEDDMAERLMKMVGFRNIAVHDYRKMNLDIVKSIVNDELNVFLDFSKWAIQGEPDV
jgi:uncharacterized protein YutE (UPF0331/DUF86 family)